MTYLSSSSQIQLPQQSVLVSFRVLPQRPHLGLDAVFVRAVFFFAKGLSLRSNKKRRMEAYSAPPAWMFRTLISKFSVLPAIG
jgi:hypothetical protein